MIDLDRAQLLAISGLTLASHLDGRTWFEKIKLTDLGREPAWQLRQHQQHEDSLSISLVVSRCAIL